MTAAEFVLLEFMFVCKITISRIKKFNGPIYEAAGKVGCMLIYR